jgi:Fe-S cluster assembly ATPase SufC
MLEWVSSMKKRDVSTIENDEARQKAVTLAMQNPPRIVEKKVKAVK